MSGCWDSCRKSDLVSGYEVASQLASIEELINQGLPVWTVLRLLILQSVVGGGIKPKVFDSFRREFLQVGNLLPTWTLAGGPADDIETRCMVTTDSPSSSSCRICHSSTGSLPALPSPCSRPCGNRCA